ncbi:MAG: cytochrome c [Hyphomonadaceae bacterium]|nr:cytochrome c [Hyphomonadaceae bacterium]
MTNRLAYRIAYSAMVFALAAACTPGGETDGASAPPAADQPAIAPPTEPTTSADPNTTDTLTTTTPADPAATTPAAAPAATPEELASGASAYARTCAMCHGARGEGSPAGSAITAKDAAVIANKITKGQINPGDKMPPMGGMMSPEEVAHVAKFVAAGFPAQ